MTLQMNGKERKSIQVATAATTNYYLFLYYMITRNQWLSSKLMIMQDWLLLFPLAADCCVITALLVS